jgi:hypothetical protein
MVEVRSPLIGTVVRVDTAPGEIVHPDTPVVIVESMKMEHVVVAGVTGRIAAIAVVAGATLREGDVLLTIDEIDAATIASERAPVVVGVAATTGTRADLAEVVERHRVGLDEARPDAVERRRRTGQRTARENIDDLIDPGSLVEYGPMVVAAQRRRRTLDDLIARTPADGLVAGVATVDGHPTAVCRTTTVQPAPRAARPPPEGPPVQIIERQKRVVFFAEGVAASTSTPTAGGADLDCLAFWLWGGLSGLVRGEHHRVVLRRERRHPRCCDVVIRFCRSNIGMGGPAMIEGGGLGVFPPEAVGPLDVQIANGVVDVAVADEAAAVAVARQYLSYFQGRAAEWSCPDQTALRDIIPENRRRAYDVRRLVGPR